MLLLSLAAARTRAGGVVCPDVPLRDQAGIAAALKLDCGAFLAGQNEAALASEDDGAPDCMALKTQLLAAGSRDRAATRAQRFSCACITGYTDAALGAEGFYRSISFDTLLHDVHCADRCGVAYQQVAQARARESCGCVNVHGCRFGARKVAALVAQARALGDVGNAALLVLPDNVVLDASLVFCAQTHCSPPAPVAPRAEILCAAHGIGFRWCDACDALCAVGSAASANATCSRTAEPPYCRRVCAPGFFMAAGAAACAPCRACGADELELRECAPASDRACAGCPYGTYLPAARADRRACLPCPPGEHSPRGDASCVPAAEAVPLATNAGANCSALARGWDARRQRCAPCPPNSVAGGDSACAEYPAHELAGGGGACAPCPRSHSRPRGHALCEPCPPGSTGRPCAPCAAGTVNPGGLEACVACDGGAVPNAARTACEACPPHQLAARGQGGACDFCAEGARPGPDGACVPCELSQWAQCAPPLVMDACHGDFHPRASGAPCACGCRACPFVPGAADLPAGTRAAAGRCALACGAGERLLRDGRALARCVADRAVDARAGGGLFFYDPADSADLTLHSCADVTVAPIGLLRLEPAVSPGIANDTASQLSPEWCRGLSPGACPLPGSDGVRGLADVAAQHAVRARFWRHRDAIGCFFRCQVGYVFQTSPETGRPECSAG